MQTQAVRCNLCAEDNYRVLERSEEFAVVKCRSCGLIYVNPQPDKTVLFAHYNEAYFSPWYDKQRFARIKMWQRRLKEIESKVKPGVLLDVGSGCGQFLAEAKKRGWQVHGNEISGHGVQYAKTRFGIDLVNAELPDAGFPENFFDVVTMWHVLEHTRDPLAHLQVCRRMLKLGGLLVVAVPNADDLLFQWAYMLLRLRRTKYFTPGDRELHLFQFSKQTLEAMLLKAGFTQMRYNLDTGHTVYSDRILDFFASAIYAVFRINLGLAFEILATK